MNSLMFQTLELKAQVLENEKEAAGNLRRRLRDEGVFLINLMGSPGAGKTTTLVRTIRALQDRYRIGVIEADADSDVDAKTIAAEGIRVVQVHTGGSCHMDMHMTQQGLDALQTKDLDVVFLENVGNLVCPAEFDVGAALSVMILSAPEGDDKPLKYPLMFQVSDVLLVNKMDTAEVFSFDLDRMRDNVAHRNSRICIFPVSAIDGSGFDEWTDWLRTRIDAFKTQVQTDPAVGILAGGDGR